MRLNNDDDGDYGYDADVVDDSGEGDRRSRSLPLAKPSSEPIDPPNCLDKAADDRCQRLAHPVSVKQTERRENGQLHDPCTAMRATCWEERRERQQLSPSEPWRQHRCCRSAESPIFSDLFHAFWQHISSLCSEDLRCLRTDAEY